MASIGIRYGMLGQLFGFHYFAQVARSGFHVFYKLFKVPFKYHKRAVLVATPYLYLVRLGVVLHLYARYVAALGAFVGYWGFLFVLRLHCITVL